MSTGVWPWIVVIIVIILAIIVIGVIWRLARRSGQSERLHESFGPEYDRMVSRHQNRERAEAELLKRKERVDALDIRPLAPADRSRFADAWRATQARFVDKPIEATAAADRLVTDLLRVRGYPMSEFEQRADDVSVHHPNVVASYRAAHATSLASEQGQASTEDLRAAMLHYRTLFDELLGDSGTQHTQTPERTEVG